MVNNIQFPTHELQNTLDLVISSAWSTVLSHFRHGEQVSDHNIVYFKHECGKGVPLQNMVSFRNMKNIN